MRQELEERVDQRTRELVDSQLQYKQLASRFELRASAAEEQQRQLVS